MNLTERRKQFLQQIMRLYKKSGLPVHYVTLANLLGVSKWTAYDMLKELEKSGFLKRDYIVNPNELGRSVIVFSPTTKADELFGQIREVTFDADQLNGVKKKVLEMIFELQSTKNLQQSLEFILNEIPKANVRTEFCMYILAILILYLHALGKVQKDMVKNIIVVANRHDIKITLFVGMVVGTAIQSVAQELDPRISDLIGSFLKHLDQLSMNEMQILIEFLQEAIN
ncbi:iron dependent repressor [Desulfotomaculum nigrificans CO-1-SRB]|uniref:Iron dependent repressor n=1 Tax=Desulfotomaculum nigrificans (strain DSM 14880 / VKM B-2319 / CO-1-SRB) TaxID=868595 RepID=F6B3H1_DESCC|nr:Lrp/AsnC family transcriptional regulator [Desulfotomaculum nigrificans]AEF94000.1 iron dependent repressor [Desulfotomaculum nigrificans CO-1-SRB]